MRMFYGILMCCLFVTPVMGASISSMDFESGSDSKSAGTIENGDDTKTLRYVEQPQPPSQIIINNNRSDIIIQKKSSRVFRHSGSNGSEARNNIGGLKTK